MKKLLPDLHVYSIYDIDLQALKKRGIKGIVTDLDNTLIEWDRPNATPKLMEWLNHLKEEGFQVIVVSNNNRIRVSAFADPLGIPYIHAAKKPTRTPFQDAMRRLDLSPEEIVVIGDQMFTDVLGGNRLGLYTILVVPVAQTDGFFTRFNRQLERIALSWMRKKGLITWED
ncbi:YqeG family HAD IIIA-type phosphatase [Ammoniphilus sp. CFH 90114]|uniref:YqeG family HAD IIIA-type phosphatase n=1 Tax=Ammoniphilus sp. CFH 90114 TaxID=2493665 RepID=UPI00100DED06|nr:YqeG family HAD IIIA-type phosphatase [Ammoniphilus sp. CFH 90114]RXT15496.1 YqeG family HAD IIIA-type phosphatase [Ammoniphilus sp. CFH 90114]